MRASAERYHDDRWTLSAEHGPLDPDGDPSEPYDETLTGVRVTKKREEQVAEQSDERGGPSNDVTLVIHAG